MTHFIAKRYWRDDKLLMSSVLAWLTERQIQGRSYLTDWQSFKKFYIKNDSSSKKGKRKQQSSVFTKPTLVDMEKSHCSVVRSNKHCKPPPEPGRIHLEVYTVRRHLQELCGIYEWRATRQDQPNRVVYVGSTCTRCGHYEPLQSRILGYCSHGNHKAALINDALTKGYTLEVRYKQACNEPQARNLENEPLDMYDYAWNKRRNGGKGGIRLLPIW